MCHFIVLFISNVRKGQVPETIAISFLLLVISLRIFHINEEITPER